MAKNDDKKPEIDEAAADPKATETKAKPEDKAKKPEAESKVAEEEPDLTGLVKMHKDGKHIHAHPDVVEHHKSNGWKPA